MSISVITGCYIQDKGFGDASVCKLRFLLIYDEQEMCHFTLGFLSKFEGISLS